MTTHFADRLLEAIATKGSPVCVGLDPVYERLPEKIRKKFAGDFAGQAEAVKTFCLTLLELVAPYVPAVKPQSAYFEMYGWLGVAAYEECVAKAHDLGLVVIGDVKRNDIGSTAAAYAQGHLNNGPGSPDSVTVNGYLGSDGIKPFLSQATPAGKGLFVLVRTSNPSARELQDLVTQGGGRKVYEHVADLVASLGAGSVGASGYSNVGAVVGATYPDEARALRELMPQQIFLVPGYGAQGGTAADAAASFKDGTGAIVNASRSVIFAYNEKPCAGTDWKQAIDLAAREFANDIAAATGHK